jgi:cobalt-zinc-cadmium efflux system outer membrane protein
MNEFMITGRRDSPTQRNIGLCVSVSLRLVIIVLAFSTSAVAQEGTVEQLVATALERSPEIRAARTAITAAGGQLTQAGLRPNPTLSGSQMLMTGAQHQTLLEVEWPLDLFRREGRVGTAQHAIEATTLGVQDRERMLAASVRSQAGRVLAARRNVDIMNEALIAARRMRELLDSRVTEGETPKLDANIAAVEAGRIEADLAIAQADADAAAIELKALAGLRSSDPLNLRDSLEALVRANPANAADATTPSVAARADIREATARIALADARVEEARRQGKTDMSLVGNYGRNLSDGREDGWLPVEVLALGPEAPVELALACHADGVARENGERVIVEQVVDRHLSRYATKRNRDDAPT